MRRSRRGLAVGEERIKNFVDRDENGPAEVGEILINFQIVSHLFDHKNAKSAATIPTKISPNAAWHGEQNCSFKSGRYPTCGCTNWKTAVFLLGLPTYRGRWGGFVFCSGARACAPSARSANFAYFWLLRSVSMLQYSRGSNSA